MPIERTNGESVRVVLDTNVVISGFLWRGAPNRVLGLARANRIRIYTSEALVSELRDVLSRDNSAVERVAGNRFSEYTNVVTVVTTMPIRRTIVADPDDDAVLACATAANADFIVTGDPHLLRLGSYEGVPIMTPGQRLARLNG